MITITRAAFAMPLLFTSLILTSCGSDDSTDPTPQPATKTLSASTTAINTGNAFYLDDLGIISNTTWTISSNQQWCTVSPDSGTNNGTVQVYLTPNSGGQTRTATLTLSGTNAATVLIQVTQGNTNPGSGYLCTGKPNVNSYYPLAQGNKWEYGFNYYTSFSSNQTYVINGTEVLDGQTYFDINYYYPTTQGSGSLYFRTDGSGNIFQHISDSAYLYLPGNPTVGQEIGADPGNGFVPSRKVISLTGTANTGLCNYTDLLVIERYGQNGSPIGRQYFKKGLGLVYSTDLKLKIVTINN